MAHTKLCAFFLAAFIQRTLSILVQGHQKRADTSFDYVIVGGGTAGLTLAARLSENSAFQVAVVEAGALYEVSNPLLSSTPAGDVIFVGASPLDTNSFVD